MIKAKAPTRINFAGGGTDIEPYVSDYGSYVLSAAIKLYARASYGPDLDMNPEGQIEIILSQMAGKGNVRIINDVYSTSGLGCSASCFVAGIKAIYPSLNQDQIAQLSFYLERNIMGIAGGKQDQYCAAYGGAVFLVFEGERTEISQVDIPDELIRLLLLVYTGSRPNDGSDIIKDQLARHNVKALHRQKQIAKSMRDCLIARDIDGFGKLLNDCWKTKLELSSRVSNERIESLYEQALSMGAMAGCIMGAGGGGYMLLMESPKSEGELRQNLIHADIAYHNVEIDTNGVQIQ